MARMRASADDFHLQRLKRRHRRLGLLESQNRRRQASDLARSRGRSELDSIPEHRSQRSDAERQGLPARPWPCDSRARVDLVTRSACACTPTTLNATTGRHRHPTETAASTSRLKTCLVMLIPRCSKPLGTLNAFEIRVVCGPTVLLASHLSG